MTPAQRKKADAAHHAASEWARTCSLETLRHAENDRVAKSYGIRPIDASRILQAVCKERGVTNG